MENSCIIVTQNQSCCNERYDFPILSRGPRKNPSAPRSWSYDFPIHELDGLPYVAKLANFQWQCDDLVKLTTENRSQRKQKKQTKHFPCLQTFLLSDQILSHSMCTFAFEDPWQNNKRNLRGDFCSGKLGKNTSAPNKHRNLKWLADY